jgi:hypothetical protein
VFYTHSMVVSAATWTAVVWFYAFLGRIIFTTILDTIFGTALGINFNRIGMFSGYIAANAFFLAVLLIILAVNS